MVNESGSIVGCGFLGFSLILRTQWNSWIKRKELQDCRVSDSWFGQGQTDSEDCRHGAIARHSLPVLASLMWNPGICGSLGTGGEIALRV